VKARVFDLFDFYMGGGALPLSSQHPEALLEQLYQEAKQRRSAALVSLLETTTSAGSAVYDLPRDAVTILAVFWDNDPLDHEDISSLDTDAEDWRAQQGTPRAWVQGFEDHLTVRLVPKPTQAGVLRVLYEDAREDLPPWLESVIALDMIAAWLLRRSPQRDPESAQAFQRVASLLASLVL